MFWIWWLCRSVSWLESANSKSEAGAFKDALAGVKILGNPGSIDGAKSERLVSV